MKYSYTLFDDGELHYITDWVKRISYTYYRKNWNIGSADVRWIIGRDIEVTKKEYEFIKNNPEMFNDV